MNKEISESGRTVETAGGGIGEDAVDAVEFATTLMVEVVGG